MEQALFGGVELTGLSLPLAAAATEDTELLELGTSRLCSGYLAEVSTWFQ